MMSQNFDLVIAGGGILGLCLARSYRSKYPDLSIAVLEKETFLGAHGSGRNSGVLHSGVYYPETSLKAKFAADGARVLREFCQQHKVPHAVVGKVILPTRSEDDQTLDQLVTRGATNGANVRLLTAQELQKLEPLAVSSSGRAIHVPDSTVVDPAAVMGKMAEVCRAEKISVLLGHKVVSVSLSTRMVMVQAANDSVSIGFGHLVNSAGIFADKIAHAFDVGRRYAVMPFKGLYYELNPAVAAKIRGHIYPVPDLRLPFLGVHFTRGVHGKVYLGPNALPSLGRENYQGFRGVEGPEAVRILGRNMGQYWRNEQGFRPLVHDELARLFKGPFVRAAQRLVPSVVADDMQRSQKVGIRAQLFDTLDHKLVMDFLVEKGPHSTHVLNAISPGFTCGPSFAAHVVQNFPL